MRKFWENLSNQGLSVSLLPRFRADRSTMFPLPAPPPNPCLSGPIIIIIGVYLAFEMVVLVLILFCSSVLRATPRQLCKPKNLKPVSVVNVYVCPPCWEGYEDGSV